MALDGLRLELTRKLAVAARGIADEWERELRDTSPTDTGTMRDATHTSVQASVGRVTITATVDVPYAGIVAEGSPPHVITPKAAKSLRFVARSGEVVYAQRVDHPGQTANQWWNDSIQGLPGLVRRVWARS